MKNILKNAKWFIIESFKYNNPKTFKEYLNIILKIPQKTIWFCYVMYKDKAVCK